MNESVSVENIEKMSFKFAGPAEEFEGEESCGICLEDYEAGMEVCRLPCNHFCCRKCTEKMFAIPLVNSNNDSDNDLLNDLGNGTNNDLNNGSDNDSDNGTDNG